MTSADFLHHHDQKPVRSSCIQGHTCFNLATSFSTSKQSTHSSTVSALVHSEKSGPAQACGHRTGKLWPRTLKMMCCVRQDLQKACLQASIMNRLSSCMISSQMAHSERLKSGCSVIESNMQGCAGRGTVTGGSALHAGGLGASHEVASAGSMRVVPATARWYPRSQQSLIVCCMEQEA